MQSLDPSIQKRLERLELLESHHRYCKLAAPALAPLQSPPASPKVSSHGPEVVPGPDRAVARCAASLGASGKDSGFDQTPEATKSPKLDVIQYVNPPSQKPNEEWIRRLVREARAIIATVPQGSDWCATWSDLGVTTEQNSKAVAADVLGIPSMCGSLSKATLSVHTSPEYSIQDRLSAYARMIVTSRPAAERATRVASFQELVFVSACVVLKKHGILNHEHQNTLRLGVRNSNSSTYIQRLGSGALWVNQTINVLFWNGWDHRAAPLFFLVQDLAQYARFTQDPELSRKCLEKPLFRKEYLEGVTDVPALAELSISHIVKRLLGDALTQAEIDEALGYTAMRPQSVTGKKRKSDTPSTGRRKKQLVKRPQGAPGTNAHSASAGISMHNALLNLKPPPPDARVRSKHLP